MVSVPFWIYIVLAGIIISAIMTIKTTKEEQQIEQEFIEKEGEVYIKRMHQEMQRRKNKNSSFHVE